jgi:DNA-binding NarL/FixJ family response regulator
MRVLIVEDEALIAMDLAMLVTELGHDFCAIAASAAGAIAPAEAHNPDVVLMDIRLAQGSSGIDAAREFHVRLALRCIFLSANLDEPSRTALLPYDPVDFIGKPVMPIVLERALKKGQQELTGV